MSDDILQSKLDDIDKINNVLRELIIKIYSRLDKNNLDDDTVTFLIDLIEELENCRINLKNLNIELIEDFLTSRKNRSKLLCQSLFEADEMQKEHKKMQLKSVKYIGFNEDVNCMIPSRH